MLQRLASFLFGCRHSHLGGWFRDRDGDYRPCLDCGAQIKTKVQLDGVLPSALGNYRLANRQAPPAGNEGPRLTGLEQQWLKDIGVKT